jgi:hypothetical protein
MAVIAGSRNEALSGHRACGEQDERQSSDQSFHFPSPLFEREVHAHMELDGLEIMRCLLTRAFSGAEYVNLFQY